MNLLLLSGNSIRNKEWIYELNDNIKQMFDKTYILDYEHWKNKQENINLETELGKLKSVAAELGEYNIFAKSIGSVLTIKGIYEGVLAPKKIMITGLPLYVIKEQKIPLEKWLSSFITPILLIQNKNDKVGKFSEVRNYLYEYLPNSDISLIETPGNTHDYIDFELLKEQVSKFLT